MSCTLDKIKNDTFKQFLDLDFKDVTSKRFNSEGVMIFDYENSDKYKTYEAGLKARESVKERIEKVIEDWAKVKFGPAFTKGFLDEREGSGKLTLKYQFPEKLEKGYERKLQRDAEFSARREQERIISENMNINHSLFESRNKLYSLETNKGSEVFGVVKKIIKDYDESRVYDYTEEIKSILFNGELKDTTAKEVLENILKSGFYTKNSYMSKLIDKLLISTKAKVAIVDRSELVDFNTYMQYNTQTKAISVSEETLGLVSSIDSGISKFVHEVFHDRTMRVLLQPKNKSEQDLVKDLDQTFKKVKDLLEKEFPHELSSLTEFTAGMFSNKKFEASVRNIINTNTNFWRKIIDYFKQLLNLDTNYDKLLEQVVQLVDISDEEYSSKKEETLESKYNIGTSIKVDHKALDNLNKRIENVFDYLTIKAERTGHSKAFTENVKNITKDLKGFEKLYTKESNEYKLKNIELFNNFMKGQISSLDHLLTNPTNFNVNIFHSSKAYIESFISVQEDIEKSLRELHNDNFINDKDFDNYLNETNNIKKSALSIWDKTIKAGKRLIQEDNTLYSDQYKEVLLRYTSEYKDDGRKLNLSKNELDSYVEKQIALNRNKILEESKSEFNALINSPLVDIGTMSSYFNSEKDFTHPIIQIFSKILDSVKHTYDNLIQPRLITFQKDTNDFLNGKISKSSDVIYKNLVEWSDDFGYILKGEYSVAYNDSYKKLRKDIEDKKISKSEISKWYQENTIKDSEGNISPNPKWKTDLSNLSKDEQDYLIKLQEIAVESHKNYPFDVKSLKKMTVGATYYVLPSMLKTTLNNLKTGNLLSTAKEMYNETFRVREDDTEFGEDPLLLGDKKHIVYTDLSGKEVKYVPIHYRGKLEKSKQSIDLATLYAMEFQNSVKNKTKSKVSSDLTMFIDVIQENKFIKKVGNKVKVGPNGNPVLYGKEDANLVKMLETMLNNRLYDKTSEYAGKVLGQDINKLESFVRGIVSRSSMALNALGAPVNAITGKTQSFLERLRDPNITLKDGINAEKFFWANLGSTMDDLGRNVYKSLPNQILMSYGGLVTAQMVQNNFEKNKALALTDGLKPIYMFQEGGEHWHQAVHTLAILESAKLLNSDGEYLDKEGNITTKDKAASLLDIQTKDENDNLTTSLKTPFYTTIDRMKEFNSGGNIAVRSYIQSSLIKTNGQYSAEYKAEMERLAAGKMLMHFKKHIISPMLSRWRGLSTNLGKNENIVLNYNYDLQRPDEGSYVTSLRFIKDHFIPKTRQIQDYITQLQSIGKTWNQMDDWEKGNLKRVMAEIAIINSVFALSLLFAGAASGDDDDFWYAAALFKRLEKDSSQYYDVTEAWRIIKNPVSTLTFLETTVSTAGAIQDLVNPLDSDTGQSLQKHGLKLAKIVVPGVRLLTSKSKTQYDFYNRN